MKRYLRIILIKIILIAALPVIGYSQKGEADTVQLLANSLTSPARVSKNKDKLRMSLLSEEKYGFQLINKRQKQTRIPFELQSNLIVVPVKINNSDTLHFILDTGVSSIIITDPKVATMQHMKALRKVRIAGAGEGKDIQASVVLNNTLQMGDMIGFRQNLVVLDDDVLQLSQFVGSQIHGIIGYDIFNRFVVTIDFVSREIVLQNPEDYVYKPKKGMKFPISIEENKPYFSSLELVDSDKVTPLKVVLDTGAGHALSIDLAKSTTLHTPDKVVKAQLGRGLSGIINGSLGRIRKTRLGSLEIPNIIASFPDSTSVKAKVSPNSSRQGNIGCELLRRFTVTFNYRDQYIVLKPIPRRLREPFEHNMTGMELTAKGQSFREYFIERILNSSPAEEAGFKVGDNIIMINGRPSRDVSISEIYKMFQKKEGKVVDFVIKRGNEYLITSLKLRRLI